MVNATTLVAGDNAIKNILVGMGHTVTVTQATASATSDTAGQNLIYISSTVGSADVNTKYRNVTKPVLASESGVYDDMNLTGTATTEFGGTVTQTQIVIQTPGHQLAAGLTGTVDVTTSGKTIGWGKPSASAVKIANQVGDATKEVIFAYDVGAAMVGLNAPGRRVGFFASDSSAFVYTAAGTALLKAAVNWALGVVPPTITTQPADKSVNTGSTATFSVVATGTTPLAYQWMKNGANITGATTSSFTTPAIVAADNGAAYAVIVSNAAGTVTSSNAILTVGTAPTITTQPVSQTVNLGATATFSVVAAGTAPLTYQWRKNGTSISGATSASYTTPATLAADNGALFSVVVSGNAGATVTSANATLTVGSAPPTITTQPANQTVNPGMTATFSVVASGTAPLAYQWRKNGSDITGATSASFTTPAVTAADNGALFSVVVGNAGGNVTSGNGLLTVNVPPTITTQPANKSTAVGGTANFTVVAAGTAPLSYQWSKNSVNIPGATTASYTTPATVAGDNGAAFAVNVSNVAGNTNSANAILTVGTAPTISTQPANQTVNLGATATFSVVAAGTAPLTYQWRKNGTSISGATSASYTTPATVAADTGALFSVVVGNSFGSITSGNGLLTVNLPPTITTQPASQTVTAGATATFSVAAAGTAPFAYQWMKNSVNIPGATSASYTTPATVAGDNGAVFAVNISNLAGNINSANATLTIGAAPPTIVTQPGNQTVNIGATATFSVVASGTAPLTYQWRKNGASISGATSASYTTPATIAADNGALFSVVVGNAGGNVTSGNGLLTVNVPPTVTTQPTNQTVNAGAAATFSVVATGTAPLAYQWRKNGTNISGATSASYTTPATTASDNGALFSVLISNMVGNVTSGDGLLTVNSPPSIISPPHDTTVTVGQVAVFRVTAAGMAPLAYQWKKGATNVSGATGSTYTTPVTTLSDNGAVFSVVITNSLGSVTSPSATLFVVSSATVPTITGQPVSTSVTLGQAATFRVTATGSPAPSYQWKKNGANIPGETAATYTLAQAFRSDSGAVFTVFVSNSAGGVTSATAELAVLPRPNNQIFTLSGEIFDPARSPIGAGTPVNRDFTVNLYATPTGGTSLYTETFLTANAQSISVAEGIFTLKLGTGTSSQDLPSVVANNSSLYAELKVGLPNSALETIQPRMAVTAPLLSGTPRVLDGAGPPAAAAAVGTYYQNSTDGTLWLRMKTSWVKISQ